MRLSACGKNSIRFQASPNGRIENQDWTLMPRKAMASAWLENDFAVLENGSMRAELYKDGRAVYYCRDKKILAEKPELAFGQGIRNYRSKASGQWSARVTFEPNEKEHFYGLGHESTGCFDLKGCTIDLRHVNAKCAIPFVYSSLGYGFFVEYAVHRALRIGQ